MLVPPATPNSIKADGGQRLRYLSVDCFGAGKPKEPTWDEHVKAICRERGWSYDQVAGGGIGEIGRRVTLRPPSDRPQSC